MYRKKESDKKLCGKFFFYFLFATNFFREGLKERKKVQIINF